MARCEDFPCCGHEYGCCPRRNENGEQIEMICLCGASVPLSSSSSICQACLRESNEEDWHDEDDEDWHDEDDEGYDDDQREYDDPFSYSDEY